MAEQEQQQEQERELSAEEVLERVKQLKISDILLSTLITLSQLGYGKLEPATRDLEQAKLAIDSMDALMAVLEPTMQEDIKRDFSQVVTNLKLAYASAAKEASGGS
jgi:hypothetical protein